MVTRWLERARGCAHYDFCPWANRYVYWLKKPVGWMGLAFFASLLLGLIVSPKALFVAAAIAALCVLGMAWPRLALWGIRGRLRWDSDRCEEGDTIQVHLEIENRWIWPVWGLVVQTDRQVATRPEAPGAPIALSRVAPLARSNFVWNCRPSARGVFPIEKIAISTSFPFGLWSAKREMEVVHPLIVWPSTTRLIDLPDRHGKTLAAHGAMCAKAGHEGDWFGVRPFREGDSLRQIHWAQSARRESLIVCERQQFSRHHVMLWLDPHAHHSCLDDDQKECLIRTLASFVKQFNQHSWCVQVWFGEQSQWVHAGRSHLESFLDSLASFQWSDWSDSTSLEFPFNMHSNWWIGLTTTERYRQIERMDRSFPEGIDWVLLQGKSVEEDCSVSKFRDDVMVIDDQWDTDTQLQTAWQSYCIQLQRKVVA